MAGYNLREVTPTINTVEYDIGDCIFVSTEIDNFFPGPNSAAEVAKPDLRLWPPYLFGSNPESNTYFLIISATLLSDISNTLPDLISE